VYTCSQYNTVLFSTEPKITAEIPKNQSFTDGFWIHWKLDGMDHIPDNLDITLTVYVGDQQWTVSDPRKLSEYVELPLEGDNAEVSFTISIGSSWSDTVTINVTNTPVESK